MSKFTKGKWMYSDVLYEVIAITHPEVPDIPPTVAEVRSEINMYDPYGTEEELHANGRLIAAAPELYALAEELANLPDEQCMIGPLIHEARRLIACIDSEEVQ